MQARTPFLTAAWRQLAMLNFEVPPDLLLRHVPAGTGLDSYNGRTIVSIVGFRFEDTRVRGWRIPLHVHFDEVNLRFYVRHGEKRGVVFLKEIVPRPAIAWVARAKYNEPYVALPMRHSVNEGRDVRYSWYFSGRWNSIHLRANGAPHLPAPGSEEEFIAEHYWGYTRQTDGATIEYEVRHPAWRVWQAHDASFDCDARAVYGAEIAPYLGKPSSALLAEGSEVAVYRGERLATAN